MFRPSKRAAGDDAAPPSRRLRVTPPPAAAPGSSNSELPPPKRRFASIVLVVLFSILPVKRATDSLRIGRLEMGLKALRHEFRQVYGTLLRELGQLRHELGQVHTLLRKQDSIKKLFLSKQDKMKGPSPNQHNHENLTREEGTNQQGTSAEANEGSPEAVTEGKDTGIRLRFCSGMKPRVYKGDEISIRVGIFDGDKIIESGPFSKLNIEVLALDGNFPFDSRGSWTSKEFEEHIACDRDGKGNVLVGKGTNAQLINGECTLGSIRFREGSCRSSSRTFIIGARVCDGQSFCGRVQEAVTIPVTVQDRRNKYNEKSYPPKLNDGVHRLENISKKGEYRERLKKQNIHTVEHFLKALHKDENNLRSILHIEQSNSKSWDKMVSHAKTCCLKDKPELKVYSCQEKNVKLFFNCVHHLVGARFGSHYVASDKFERAQKNLVDTLKKNAYDQLDGLTADHEMKDNIPVLIDMNTEGGVGPSCITSSAPQQINSGHHIAEHQVGGTAASEVLSPCVPHDSNSIPDPDTSYNYQVGDFTTVEGLMHGVNVSPFAVVNDGASTSSSVPYLTTQNYQGQGTGFAAQQHHFDGTPMQAQSFPHPQAENNNWGAPGLHHGEMSYHVGWPGDDTLEASDSANMFSYMGSTPVLVGAASLPNDDTMGTSVSAQQEWSQCQGNIPGNMSCHSDDYDVAT